MPEERLAAFRPGRVSLNRPAATLLNMLACNQPAGGARSGFQANRAHTGAVLLTAVISLLAGAGCATRTPRPLTIHSPRPGGAAPAGSAGRGQLRLLTFNVWGLPAWLNGASPQRFPRIAEGLTRLQPDLVTFQEVWTHRALQAVPATDGWWVARASRSRWVFRRNGLVTLSRHPIVGGEFRPFHNARLPDALVSKGALKTTIELPAGVRVNLWNVHLQAGPADAVRCRQIAELAAWVRAADDGQVADLVAGDFNCGPGSVSYRQLIECIGPGESEISHHQPMITYLSPEAGGDAPDALDHLFVRLRSPLESVRVLPELAFTAPTPQDRLSDHFGMLVGLRLDSAAPQLVRQKPASPPLAGLTTRIADN